MARTYAPSFDASPPTRSPSLLDLSTTHSNRKTQYLCLTVNRPLLQPLVRGLVRFHIGHLLCALWNITSCRLFKEKPIQEPLLLIYRDEPCVVIGRNQNPWKEVNFPALRRANIPFIRRRSGGGTVYHVTSLLLSDARPSP